VHVTGYDAAQNTSTAARKMSTALMVKLRSRWRPAHAGLLAAEFTIRAGPARQERDAARAVSPYRRALSILSM
jgi:hypothetical protein